MKKINIKYIYVSKVIVLLLTFTSLVATIIKVTVGFDIDEAFVITQANRLVQGDYLFLNMWEVHQTSAIFMAPMIELFQIVMGSLEYVVIYLRIVGVMIQFLISVFIYQKLKSKFDGLLSFLVACVFFNFLPRWTQNAEYGSVLIWSYMLMTLFILQILENKKGLNRTNLILLYLASISFSFSILAYPTIIILFPFLCYLFLRIMKKNNWTKSHRYGGVIIFISGCFLNASIFLTYVLRHISLKKLIAILPFVTQDSNHGNSISQKVEIYITESGKLLFRIGIFTLISIVFFIILRLILLKRENKLFMNNQLLFFGLLLINLFPLAMIGCNMVGINSGPYGLQVRYLVLFIAGIFLYRYIKEELFEIFFLWWLPAIFIYSAALLASNLGLEVNAAFLFTGVLASAIIIYQYIEKLTVQYQGKANKVLSFCTLVILLLCTIFCKGYLVRITGTSEANILERRSQIEYGPEKGIYVYESEKQRYNQVYSCISINSSQEDTVLYLSEDAIGNLFTSGKYTSASCDGTAIYGLDWVEYFKTHEKPTVIIIDERKVGSINSFLTTNHFGKWIVDEYNIIVKDVEVLNELCVIK